ncbi:hypothetical protein CDAR_487141 [Caerostris darwini]|uniref:Uncharacterized protein n=1 Tax=Caerostris darwini TaxID=1538125 RepID=A0AAV4TXV1_9ARAC|nr:hypothetical protein CDAR_487141 [Caerostris darwini]
MFPGGNTAMNLATKTNVSHLCINGIGANSPANELLWHKEVQMFSINSSTSSYVNFCLSLLHKNRRRCALSASLPPTTPYPLLMGRGEGWKRNRS